MVTPPQTRRDRGFALGLLTGACVGAGLAFWLAPKLVTEITERVSASIRNLGDRASERYEQTSTRLEGVVGDVTRRGKNVRDNVADAVERGAQTVERFAAATKRDRS
jgi:gas vesicle protein